MYDEEIDLGIIISDVIKQGLCVILNPPYTTIWQNKRFLAYITEHFPNSVIASTYFTKPLGGDFVEKPIFGRLGENVRIHAREEFKTKGDFKHQPKIFQKFYPLLKDDEDYYYQVGMFYTNQPSALNLRAEENPIITDDCEFMSHYIL
jgi:glutathionylspermidine synthase